MKVRGQNTSAIRTRRRIRRAFLEMHSEGIPGSKMTVSDLVRRAEISRAAFYTHYSDLDAVGSEIVDELLIQALGDEEASTTADVLAMVRRLLGYFRQRETAAGMLLGSDFPRAFMQQLKYILRQRCHGAFTDKQQELRFALFADGLIEELIAYFQQRWDMSFETLEATLLEVLRCLLYEKENQ